jgi:hypothetical protein
MQENMAEATLILKAGNCSWRGCMFCGYGRNTGYRPTEENLKREFDGFFSNTGGEVDTIKVFGSGSFLDEKQVPEKARAYFAEKCRERKIKKLVVESRPEHVSREKLAGFSGLELVVAIGLEVADDRLLDRINKGFHLKDYEKAVGEIHSAGAKTRTYLLVNIPGEREDTMDRSVEYALKHSDGVVLINLLPHGGTPLFKMWIDGEWNYLSRREFREKTKKWAENPRVELDEETFRFTPHFPADMRRPLRGVGEEYLTHPYFEVWQDYLVRWYEPPREKMPLMLPCSHAKPYSESETHHRVISILDKTGTRMRFHEMMISNPGVIPREFEDRYPFNNYDWDERFETEEIKKRYIEVTEQRIEKYLNAHKEYIKRAYCYLKPDSESYIALEKACAKAGFTLVNLLSIDAYKKAKKDPKPLQNPDALKSLEEGLRCLQRDSTS